MTVTDDNPETPENSENQASFMWRLVLMLLVLALATCVVVVITLLTFGSKPLLTALLASAATFIAALLAHFAGEFPRGNMFLASRVLASAGIRAGIPLVLLLILKVTESPMMDLGAVYFIGCFYFVSLLTDTFIHIRRFQSFNRSEINSALG